MLIVMLRHGQTKGNLEKRYVGSTDESLCETGIIKLQSLQEQMIYPAVDWVYASPLKRCLETRDLLYPQTAMSVIDDLKECNFGEFEYKTYEELKEDTRYQDWLNSLGNGEIPLGESGIEFRRRCQQGFKQVINSMTEHRQETAAMIAHGGTIMAILDAFAQIDENFYAWQVGNGRGYLVDASGWQSEQKLVVRNSI